MQIFSQRGGAKVGWLNMSWPFASIEVSPDKILLIAFARYTFTPEEVVSVEEIGFIPFFYYGVRIHHTKPDYPERVTFFTPGSRRAISEAAAEAGFRTGPAVGLVKRGFPMKILPLVVLAAVWNGFFMLDMGNAMPDQQGTPGPWSLAAILIVFVVSTLLPRSTQLQQVFIREGRNVGEILPVLRFTSWITGAFVLAFGAVIAMTTLFRS